MPVIAVETDASLAEHVFSRAGSLNLNLGLTNTVGLAEYLQLTLELGKEPASLLDVFSSEQLMSQVALGLSRPRVAAQPINVGLTLHQLRRDNERWSSFQEKLLGGILNVSRRVTLRTPLSPVSAVHIKGRTG